MTFVSEVFVFPASSHLRQAEYDPESEDLTVTFQDGRGYLYRNVERQTYRALTRASSAGAYFHRQIRDRYAFEEV